ncbi:hypothetical protein [Streptomyces sp. NPDC056987]|uniref:hypothetical protein n=1 Tax=Streptomyces sp. NPDC056987 TaxID=3345988 RepID=UPI00363FC258
MIELKRPEATLGMTEFAEISSYAQAVRRDPRFRDTRVTWDFWLVGNTMDATLREQAHQPDRVPGCAVSHLRFRIRVRTWGEIIEDCRTRLRFRREQLEHESATEHATDYLIREHTAAVTDLVADGTLPTVSAPRSGAGTRTP